MSKFHQGAPWKALRKSFLQTTIENVGFIVQCPICNLPLDLRMSGNDPTGPHLDHRLPVSTHPHLGLEPTNLFWTHNKCNRSKQYEVGNTGRPAMRRGDAPPQESDETHINYAFRPGLKHHEFCMCQHGLATSFCV